jgi:hypothetical protein
MKRVKSISLLDVAVVGLGLLQFTLSDALVRVNANPVKASEGIDST